MYPMTHMLGSRRNGVNHVSMNLDLAAFDKNTGPVRGTNYPVYTDALLDWYQRKHVQSVRLMLTWEATQSAARGPVPAAGLNYSHYWTDLTSVLTRLLARGIYVTLCPWGFNPASGDTDIVYHGAAIAAADFADFWGKFAVAVNGVTGNDQRVAFDLMNEPHTHAESGNRAGDVGISLASWFGCAQAAINAIRAAGATNTIFVPGMAYANAISFTTNGSSTAWLTLTDPRKNIAVTAHCYSGLDSPSPTVLRDACSALVNWARNHSIKVHIGEIALDAGQPESTLPTARAQWDDWIKFCAANSDVLVGWHWWGNSAAGDWWDQGDSDHGQHWGLTLDDGVTQTVYMDLIESSLKVPALFLRDNVADAGSEPNGTTTIGWESPDVWVRQTADGGTVGQTITGGSPCVVYVRVTNHGLAPSDGSEIVRLYWAKAETGLSWPAPWDGANPTHGNSVGVKPVGVIDPDTSGIVAFDWADTPDPADFGGDDHFCLLACVTTVPTPEFAGFDGVDLNANVLRASTVAWRNLHIAPAGAKKKLGNLVVANRSERVMRSQIAFDVLDATGSPARPSDGVLTITAEGLAQTKLGEQATDCAHVDDDGDGRFRVLNAGRGLPQLDLAPGEVISFGLEYVPEKGATDYAVRATQYAFDGASRQTIGGQTFVVGEVDGFTMTQRRELDDAY